MTVEPPIAASPKREQPRREQPGRESEAGGQPEPGSGGLPPADYRQFVIDLCGVMAYGELSSFERLSSDARFSPTLNDRAALARLAVIEFSHFEDVSAHLGSLGVDPEDAMAPFQASIDSFHERTRPADWYESIMKAYVIDAISGDFYRAVARPLDAETQAVVGRIQSMEHQTLELFGRLRGALADDPRLASRLALWGRRLVGEALTQVQRIGIERKFLSGLLGIHDAAGQQQHLSELFAALTRNHSRRMSALGLTA